ncbi:MAG TPA: aminomethyltransferase family protein [Candidatus Blautia faecigallinarum]|uniref:Aminomethyltransferase family protein n=1 Tax=Candidatus Blautia faecigallinarum TaxID=2838488 RepID=A0A9D2DU97_9FIRM|nr:aminomethyltransferase family protein [Candidatus Blautia faecigallinarum]
MLFKEDEAARRQHQAVRENAGWYRWTHDLVEVKGEKSTEILDYLFVNHIAAADVGRSKYTTMLNEEGKIIDDTIVMRMGEKEYWISTLYAPQMIKWIDGHKGDAEITYKDITEEWDMYSVQGPNSPAVMNRMLLDPVDGIKRFQIQDNSIDGIPVKIHRSGFSGENGFEIYCRMEDTGKIREAVKKAAKEEQAPELTILEVYVRSLPVEKGFALRQDMYGLTPFECGLDWSVDLDKSFIGKEALVKAREEGPKYRLAGLEYLEESYEDIAQKEIVYCKGVPCGFVRAAIYGYTVEKNIGFAVLEAKKAVNGTKVTVGMNGSAAVVTDKCWI